MSTATYAAVPHIVAMAKLKSESERLEHLTFVATLKRADITSARRLSHLILKRLLVRFG